MIQQSDNPSAYISKKWENIYETLCRGGDKIFSQMTNLFVLCASIGYVNDSKHPLDKNKKDIFRWINLNIEEDVTILTAIAWDTKQRDLAVLPDRKIIINVASEFAEGGIQYLHDNYFEDYMQDGQLICSKNLDIEFDLAEIVEGLRKKQSIF